MDLVDVLPSSESCKLAQISRLSGEKRLSKLNRQAAAVQKDFGRFRVWRESVWTVAGLSDPLQRLSDERRRDREAKDRDRMRFLSPVARVSYGDPYHREERRTKRWR